MRCACYRHPHYWESCSCSPWTVIVGFGLLWGKWEWDWVHFCCVFISSIFRGWDAWAFFVLLLSSLVCCQPTEFIWVYSPPPPQQYSARTCGLSRHLEPHPWHHSQKECIRLSCRGQSGGGVAPYSLFPYPLHLISSPQITSFTPAESTHTGGTKVTVFGANLAENLEDLTKVCYLFLVKRNNIRKQINT